MSCATKLVRSGAHAPQKRCGPHHQRLDGILPHLFCGASGNIRHRNIGGPRQKKLREPFLWRICHFLWRIRRDAPHNVYAEINTKVQKFFCVNLNIEHKHILKELKTFLCTIYYMPCVCERQKNIYTMNKICVVY